MRWPLTALASGEHSQAIAAAISSGRVCVGFSSPIVRTRRTFAVARRAGKVLRDGEGQALDGRLGRRVGRDVRHRRARERRGHRDDPAVVGGLDVRQECTDRVDRRPQVRVEQVAPLLERAVLERRPALVRADEVEEHLRGAELLADRVGRGSRRKRDRTGRPGCRGGAGSRPGRPIATPMQLSSSRARSASRSPSAAKRSATVGPSLPVAPVITTTRSAIDSLSAQLVGEHVHQQAVVVRAVARRARTGASRRPA